MAECVALHVLEEDPNSVLEVVDFLAANEIVTVELHDQTALVDDGLPLLFVRRVSELQGEDLFVRLALSLEHGSEGTLAKLASDFVELGRIVLFEIAGHESHVLFWRAQTLDLARGFVED